MKIFTPKLLVGVALIKPQQFISEILKRFSIAHKLENLVRKSADWIGCLGLELVQRYALYVSIYIFFVDATYQ